MVNLNADSPQMSSSGMGYSENISEAAFVLIAVGSIFVILCAALIVYGLRRRRTASPTRIPSMAEKGIFQSTDFMHSLGTWDINHPIDEVLENRKRPTWNLERFENYRHEPSQG
ncbi:hypothetical protein JTE90_010076 [Oedothorax gibbosus]|uniref:Uncharacterized protein n=1 Tax=Oedothorax gibbosus TaxID=931172 RepID=A0AAV6UYS4_9ARAC|nr:hypothetical protein JTE90_010076 [Oedothorax gibbosus]